MVIYIIAQFKWNYLDGINSINTTGQIIPLGLGTLSLGRSVWLLKDVNWRQVLHAPCVFGSNSTHQLGCNTFRVAVAARGLIDC